MKYFDSQVCAELPLTDICSKYFWLTEPTSYHDFGTVKAINHDHGEKEVNVIDSDSEEENDMAPMTADEFQKSSHWYTFKRVEFPPHICAICRANFDEDNRISVLNCHHQYHSNCIREWVTTRNPTCPTCRESSRVSNLRNTPTSIMIPI